MLRELFSIDNNGSKQLFKLRKTHAKYKNRLLRFILRRKWKRLMRLFTADIPLTTEIGENTVFPHGIMGVFISLGASIGNNCVIFHQVTIGSNTLRDSSRFGAPRIGNNVYIGAGAKIIGNVTVGNNVRIGANCIVTKDIPDNATVVMAHPRVIIKDSCNNNQFIPWNKI